MKPQYVTNDALDAVIRNAIQEDVGEGDHTSLASIPKKAVRTAELRMKANGILAGVEVAQRTFHLVDPALNFVRLKNDGDAVKNGDVAFRIEGPAAALLTAERLALNFMQRMSGIATLTREMVDLIAGTKAAILDTRKTTPGLRMLEKWAVKTGGGENHRFGLFDMILLKDNHIDFAGGIRNAIEAAKRYVEKLDKPLKIEVETRSLEEVTEALDTGMVDIVMFDNMAIPLLKQAVELVGGRIKTEASGGITRESLRAVAETGVDFISVGALTHSARSLDMSLIAVK